MFQSWKKEDLQLIAVGQHDGLDWLFTKYIVATKEGDVYRNIRPDSDEVIPEPSAYRSHDRKLKKGDLGAFLAFHGNCFVHASHKDNLKKSDIKRFLSKIDNITLSEEDRKWFGLKIKEKPKVKALKNFK